MLKYVDRKRRWLLSHKYETKSRLSNHNPVAPISSHGSILKRAAIIITVIVWQIAVIRTKCRNSFYRLFTHLVCTLINGRLFHFGLVRWFSRRQCTSTSLRKLRNRQSGMAVEMEKRRLETATARNQTHLNSLKFNRIHHFTWRFIVSMLHKNLQLAVRRMEADTGKMSETKTMRSTNSSVDGSQFIISFDFEHRTEIFIFCFSFAVQSRSRVKQRTVHRCRRQIIIVF